MQGTWPTRLALSIALLFSLSPTPAAADDAGTLGAVATRVSSAPAFDPQMKSGAWAGATVISGFHTVSTHRPSSRPTEAAILYDATTLYIEIRCAQTEPLISSQSSNNTGFGLDDFAGIGIDTSQNGSRVYYFETTPRGVRYQQSSESARYAPLWSARATTTTTGWTAWLAIPFSVMRAEAAGAVHWQVNIVRHVASVNENDTWSYDPTMSDANNVSWPVFADSRFWPRLSGLAITKSAARRGPSFDVYGLSSTGADRSSFQGADTSFGPTGIRHAGIDARIPVGGALQFVGTLAPDFSNVEFDQQTISPQEFRRVFSEYRPFFAEGASFFRGNVRSGLLSDNLIFYSPSIGPFNRGAKLEGTIGRSSVGLMQVQGTGFDDDIIGIRQTLPDQSLGWWFDGVGAHHREANLTANPAGITDRTYDAGLNGRNPRSGVGFALEYGRESGTSVPDASLATRLEEHVEVRKANYAVYAGYRSYGPYWGPVDGYTPLADLHGLVGSFSLHGSPALLPFVKQLSTTIQAQRLLDRSGAVHEMEFNPSVDALLRNGLHLYSGTSLSSLRTYDHGLTYVGYPAYRDGVTLPFNQRYVYAGYAEASPSETSMLYQWGPYTTYDAGGLPRATYLQELTLELNRNVHGFSLGFNYDATNAAYRSGGSEYQALRRVSAGRSIGPDSGVSLFLRSFLDISSTSAQRSSNLALGYHQKFRDLSELYVEYGSPSSFKTLHRVILKYVKKLGDIRNN